MILIYFSFKEIIFPSQDYFPLTPTLSPLAGRGDKGNVFFQRIY
jgi:hypothetical protein